MAIITTSRNLSSHVSTSTSSFDTSVATKSITVDTGKNFKSEDTLTVAAVGTKLPTRMRGAVSTYDSGTGALSFVVYSASATFEADEVSTTSLAIGTGTKSFKIKPGYSLASSDPIVLSDSAVGSRYMIGTVTTYDSVTGDVTANITSIGSTGTFSSWIVCSSGTFSDWVVSYMQSETLDIRNGATLTINSTPVTRPGTALCITSGKLHNQNFRYVFQVHLGPLINH